MVGDGNFGTTRSNKVDDYGKLFQKHQGEYGRDAIENHVDQGRASRVVL